MARNLTTEAVVLKNSRIGDIHKGVYLFTKDFGIINAIAHGAYKGKGKLTGVTDPFSYLDCFLYHDPVRDSYKITDVFCKEQFERIRTELFRYYYGSLWAELLIKSYGGGEQTGTLFALLVPSLYLLNGESKPYADYVLLQFLWRFLRIVGAGSSPDECGMCGRDIETEKPAYYYERENCIVCDMCASSTSPILSPGGRSYLRYTGKRRLKEAVRVTVDGATYRELIDILKTMVSEIVESPLNTLKVGEDFF